MIHTEWEAYRNIWIKLGNLRATGIKDFKDRLRVYAEVMRVLNFHHVDSLAQQTDRQRIPDAFNDDINTFIGKETLAMDLVCIWLIAHRNDEGLKERFEYAKEMLEICDLVIVPEYPFRLKELYENPPSNRELEKMLERRQYWSGKYDWREYKVLREEYGCYRIKWLDPLKCQNPRWYKKHISPDGRPYSRINQYYIDKY